LLVVALALDPFSSFIEHDATTTLQATLGISVHNIMPSSYYSTDASFPANQFESGVDIISSPVV
jgi:hypothetical protein